VNVGRVAIKRVEEDPFLGKREQQETTKKVCLERLKDQQRIFYCLFSQILCQLLKLTKTKEAFSTNIPDSLTTHCLLFGFTFHLWVMSLSMQLV